MTLRLYIGQTFTGVTIEPDARWPNMWRVRKGDMLSDLVNLSRAKDASLAWACPKGLGGDQIAVWKPSAKGTGKATVPLTKVASTTLEGAAANVSLPA